MQQKLPYLKDIVPIGTHSILLKKRIGEYPEKDFNTGEETGGKTVLYVFEYQGKEGRHYTKQWQEEVLQHFQEGEEVIVLREEIKEEGRPSYVGMRFEAPGDVAATSPSQPKSNAAMDTQKRNLDTVKLQIAHKDWSIILQAMVKTFGPDIYDREYSIDPTQSGEDIAGRILAFASIMAQKVQKEADHLSHSSSAS